MRFEAVPTPSSPDSPEGNENERVSPKKKISRKPGLLGAAALGLFAHSAEAFPASVDHGAPPEYAETAVSPDSGPTNPYESLSNEEIEALDMEGRQGFRAAMEEKLVGKVKEHEDKLRSWAETGIAQLDDDFSSPHMGYDMKLKELGTMIELFPEIKADLENGEPLSHVEDFDELREMWGDELADVVGEAFFDKMKQAYASSRARREGIKIFFANSVADYLKRYYPAEDAAIILEGLDRAKDSPYREAFKHLSLAGSPLLLQLARETGSQSDFENTLHNLSDSEKAGLLREVRFDIRDLDIPERIAEEMKEDPNAEELQESAHKIEWLGRMTKDGADNGLFDKEKLADLDARASISPRVFERMVDLHLFDQAAIRSLESAHEVASN